jgi:gliding motility-associated lipoprotein GldD
MFKKITVFLLLIFSSIACKNDVLPKPSGYLRLDYPVANYAHFENKTCPFSFDINEDAIIKGKPNCSFEIHYPKMKATLYLSYKPVNGNIKLL